MNSFPDRSKKTAACSWGGVFLEAAFSVLECQRVLAASQVPDLLGDFRTS